MSKITVLLVLVTVLVVLVLLMACQTEEEKIATRDTVAATRTARDGAGLSNKVCNKFVKKQLRNPLSADFKGFAGMGGVSTRLPGSTPRWRVTSHVDTKNAFGATKRTGFKCTVERLEGDRWKLIDLDLTDLGVK